MIQNGLWWEGDTEKVNSGHSQATAGQTACVWGSEGISAGLVITAPSLATPVIFSQLTGGCAWRKKRRGKWWVSSRRTRARGHPSAEIWCSCSVCVYVWVCVFMCVCVCDFGQTCVFVRVAIFDSISTAHLRPAHSVTWHWLCATVQICCLSRIAILPFPLTPPHPTPPPPLQHTLLHKCPPPSDFPDLVEKITSLLSLASPAPAHAFYPSPPAPSVPGRSTGARCWLGLLWEFR